MRISAKITIVFGVFLFLLGFYKMSMFLHEAAPLKNNGSSWLIFIGPIFICIGIALLDTVRNHLRNGGDAAKPLIISFFVLWIILSILGHHIARKLNEKRVRHCLQNEKTEITRAKVTNLTTHYHKQDATYYAEIEYQTANHKNIKHYIDSGNLQRFIIGQDLPIKYVVEHPKMIEIVYPIGVKQ
jgi:hypothetical protein